MTTRPKILCISFSPIDRDARVLRQLGILAEFGEVTTIGFGKAPVKATKHIEIPEHLKTLPQTLFGVLALGLRLHGLAERLIPALRYAVKKLDHTEYDLVVVNETRALPLAMRFADRSPIWGDMHEWAPEERSHVPAWKLLISPFMDYLCKKYLPKLQAVTTVNDSIADLYRKHYGIGVETIRNSIPWQKNLTPTPVNDQHIQLVHSGGAVPGRNIEALISGTLLADSRFTLDLYLVPANDGGKYLRSLKELAGNSKRIRFYDAVKPDKLPETLNKYDMGIYLLPHHNKNHELLLPNKFFDFVQARIGILFGTAPETDALIETYSLGVSATSYSAEGLAEILNRLNAEDIKQFKLNTDQAAEELSSSTDEETANTILRRLLKPAG